MHGSHSGAQFTKLISLYALVILVAGYYTNCYLQTVWLIITVHSLPSSKQYTK